MTREPIWDVYGFSDRLTETEKAVLTELRTTLEEKVHPYLNDAWSEDRLPEEIIEPLESLRLMDPPALKAAGEPVRGIFEAMRTFELARCDINVVTFFNAQAGLFRTVINQGGDAAQVAELDPKVTNYDLLGVFALTEPDNGSDVARGLQTTATQNDDGTSFARLPATPPTTKSKHSSCHVKLLASRWKRSSVKPRCALCRMPTLPTRTSRSMTMLDCETSTRSKMWPLVCA